MIESISTCSPLRTTCGRQAGQARPNQHHEHRNKVHVGEVSFVYI